MDYEVYLQDSVEDLYENAPCGYVSFLPDGTIVKVNQTFLRWLGFEREDLVRAKKIPEILTPPDKENYEVQFLPSLKSGSSVNNYQLNFLHCVGLAVPTLVSITHIKDEQGTTQVYRATIVNITQQRQYEQELLAAKLEAEEATKIKTDFISTLTHEIRSPLNAIIGLTNLLVKSKSPAQTAEYLEVLKYSSDNLLNLINDILDLSKMEAGRAILNEKPFPIRQEIKKIGVIQNIRAVEKGIAVQVILDDKLPDWLVGDEIKIRQVITNLVSNAVKFTEQGWVKLQLQVLGEEDNWCHIQFRVTDTGIGIPPERIETIFEEFTQATTDTNIQYGGTGLGLTISKRILDLYQSNIQVKSTPGLGTEFSFILKLQIGKPVAAPGLLTGANQKENNLLRGVKVLLVEDSKVNSMVVEQYLKSWGVDYELARNGLQAISKITQQEFQLILMDLHMPVLDGYEATRWIRALPQRKYQDLPIIALSAAAITDSEPCLQSAGLTDFLNKPFQPEELFAKIALHSQLNNQQEAG